tara:strand:+ start:2927 stop:3958 length:1032 start_codon:yes stop_codon:yes gene_type:complete
MYIKKIVIAISIIGLFIMGGFSYYVYNVMFASNTNFSQDFKYIYIRSNSDYYDLMQELNKYLKDTSTFNVLAKRKNYANNIKPGKFIIRKGMNNNQIINSIRSNNITVDLIFNNVKDIYDLASIVSKQIEADSTSLVDTFFEKSNGFNEETLLSMYIPNSYNFYWNTSSEDFKKRMLKEYESFWSIDRLNKAKEISLTPTEVMILASIVNEESKEISELATIAGVYINRLNNNWLLNADPTVKFAAYKHPKYKNTIIRRVLNKHLRIDSKYNTYIYKGLPPGLISMPSIISVDAVLNYEKHKYFYFAADPENPGFHSFAKNLREHKSNARKLHRALDKKGIKK